MRDLLEFMGVLLIAAIVGGLIYAIVKRKLALGISLVAGLLVVGVLWWWLSSPPAPSAPSEAGTLSQTLQAPEPKTVWEFFKNYWLWIVLVLAILFFASNALPEAWAKGANGMVVTVAVVLVGAMIVHGIWGESSSSQQVVRSEIPLASSPQSTWPPLSIPASGKKKIPILPGKRVTVAGYNFVLHTVYEGGRDCSGACPDSGVVEVYVENKSATENIVVYAYTPIQ